MIDVMGYDMIKLGIGNYDSSLINLNIFLIFFKFLNYKIRRILLN